VLAVCGVLCGADSWIQIEAFGRAKEEWLRKFLELPHGIPSHDTFGRVFCLLRPEEFRQCFLNWIQAVAEITQGNVIAIDGKTLRRSYDRQDGREAIHMVSAWSSQNHLVLGQIKTDEKSNEITAIPKLLKMLDVRGCIVTLDAMGTQKEIAKKIIAGGGDYVLGLKGNHETLHEEVKLFLDDALKQDFQEVESTYYETVDKGHGRLEVRRYWLVRDVDWLEDKDLWKGLNSLGLVEAQRTLNGKTSTERRYYLSSLQGSAQEFAEAVRGHWGIENSLHWVLDVVFREDESRVRKGYASENLAMLRHMALNLLKQNKTSKNSIKGKRLTAGWNNDFLAEVLFLRN
jgi:predicted transposase YbfD/YdcC